MKARKPTAKQQATRGAVFIRATIELLARLGARRLPDNWKATFTLNTIYGVLTVVPYENWIACRFEEPSRLPRDLYPTPNYYSGKWNFHYPDVVTPDVLPHFEHFLSKVLPEPDQSKSQPSQSRP